MRRWVRRQDRFTRVLLLAVAALSVLVAVLIASRPDAGRPGRTAAVTAPPARRAGATPGPHAKARRSPAQPAPVSIPAPPPALALRARAAPEPRRPAAPRAAAPAPAAQPPAPRVAIVVDDLGQSFAHLEQLADLGIPISVAVIPGLPATARTVREASRRGIELLLHQPMEPHEESGKNPGGGVLLTAMPPEAIRARLLESLAAVPGAVGVNNHMGSRFTEDPAGVAALMAVLRERGLFWLDSRTTAASTGPAAARALGVPAVERDVFIDAEAGADFARAQLRRLVETARARGAAVGIGHPHPETIAALRELRAELLGAGVELVPVSALARLAPAGEGTAGLVPPPGAPARQAQAAATP